MATYSSIYSGQEIDDRLTGVGATVVGGTDVEIQAALDGLTSGRGYYEKVILRGEFDVATPIDIGSWTVLELQGKITSTITTNDYVLGADTKTNIVICGNGEIDAGYTTGTQKAQPCINIENCDQFYFADLKIANAWSHCINLKLTTNFRLDGGYFDTFGDDGISILQSHYGVINSPIITNGKSETTFGSSGIEVEDASSYVIINNPIISDITGKGLAFLCDGDTPGTGGATGTGGVGAVHDCSVIGGDVRNCTTNGMGSFCKKGAITGVTLNGDGTTATASKTNMIPNHQLAVGHTVVITGATDLEFNKIATIVDIPDDDSFTYASLGTATPDATGCTISFRNNNVKFSSGVTIDGSGTDNLLIEETISSVFSNITSNASVSMGVKTNSSCADLVFSDLLITNSGEQGFGLTDVDRPVVNNVKIIDSGQLASSRSMTFATCSDVTASNISAARTVAGDFRMQKMGFDTLTGNTILSNISEVNAAGNNRLLTGVTLNDFYVSGYPYFVVQASGTATFTAGGGATLAVTHGMAEGEFTPDITSFSLTPASSLAASSVTEYYVSAVDATTFTITLDAGATGADMLFSWQARLDYDKQ